MPQDLGVSLFLSVHWRVNLASPGSSYLYSLDFLQQCVPQNIIQSSFWLYKKQTKTYNASSYRITNKKYTGYCKHLSCIHFLGRLKVYAFAKKRFKTWFGPLLLFYVDMHFLSNNMEWIDSCLLPSWGKQPLASTDERLQNLKGKIVAYLSNYSISTNTKTITVGVIYHSIFTLSRNINSLAFFLQCVSQKIYNPQFGCLRNKPKHIMHRAI